MPDILRAGSTWLAGALKDNASQPVTYRRGSNSLTLAATIGYSDAATSGAFGGVSIDRINLDFVVLVADLIIDGDEIEPTVGDVIDYGGGRYVVSRPDQQQPCCYSDLDGLTWRIHAKYRGPADG